MEQYINSQNNPNIIIKDCPIHGYYTMKKKPKRNFKQFHHIYYPDNTQPKNYYNQNDIPFISNNVNKWSPNTSLPQVDYNKYNNEIFKYNNCEEMNLHNYNNEFTNNYGFYISGSPRLKPNLTVNNMISSMNNLLPFNNDNYNNYNYMQKESFYTMIPPYFPNKRMFYSKSSDEFNLRNINTNQNINKISNERYNNRKYNNFYNENPFMMGVKPKKTIANNSPDYYNNDNYLEHSFFSQRNLNPYENNETLNSHNTDVDMDYFIYNRNRNEKRVLSESNSFPNRMVINNYKMNDNNNENNNDNNYDDDEYNEIREQKKNIINYFQKEKKKFNEYNKKKYKRVKKEKVSNKNKRIFPTYNNNRIISKKNEAKEKRDENKNDAENNNNKTMNNTKNKKNNEEIKEIKEIRKRNEEIRKKINHFKNYSLYISNNKINNKSSIYQKRSHTINNDEKKDDLIKVKNNKIIIINYEHKNNDKNDINNYIIRRNRKNEKTMENKENNNNKNQNDEKNEKLEQHMEKYYDSQGNLLGGKNIIIKRNYKDNGDNSIKEVIKEEFKSNVNNLFKKYIPIKEKEGKYIVEKKENDFNKNYEEFEDVKEFNDVINNTNRIISNNEEKNKINKIEEEENKNRNFTFGIKTNDFRIEMDNKEEKEADEQQISVKSEFEDEI